MNQLQIHTVTSSSISPLAYINNQSASGLKSFLSINEMVEITGLSRSTLQRMQSSGDLPTRMQISRKRVGWLRSDVETWLLSRVRLAA